jgi:hypothetical protein
LYGETLMEETGRCQNGFTARGVARRRLVELAALEQQAGLVRQGRAWARTLKPF